MSDEVRAHLERQKNRAIAIVLSVKERETDEFLPEDVSYALRKVILDQFNDLWAACDAALDSSVVLNQDYMDKLDEILEAVNHGG